MSNCETSKSEDKLKRVVTALAKLSNEGMYGDITITMVAGDITIMEVSQKMKF